MENSTPKIMTVEEFNEKVSGWSVTTRSRLVSSAPVFSGDHSAVQTDETLQSSIKSSKRRQFGVIVAVGFGFARHGAYISYGAGRGQGGTKGSKWKNKKGIMVKTKSKSLGLMNTRNRHAVDWFDGNIRMGLKELADISQEYYGDMAMRELLEKIDKFTIKKN